MKLGVELASAGAKSWIVVDNGGKYKSGIDYAKSLFIQQVPPEIGRCGRSSAVAIV